MTIKVSVAARLLIGCLVLPIALAATVSAQVPAPKQDKPIALVGGTIHTVTNGVIEEGSIVLEDGTITQLGENVNIPDGAQEIDVSGKHIYPGMIDAFTTLGLFEIGGIGVTIDTNETGAINPNVRAEVAFHPESRHIGTARSAGVLVAASSPSGGLISGYASAMMLDGWTWEQMSLKGQTAMIVNWPSPANENAYESAINRLSEVLADARAYHRAREASNNNGVRHDVDPRLEAMKPVLDREVPVVVAATDARQLQDAIRWAEQEDVRLVLRGGRDAIFVAHHLAEKQVPLMLTSVLGSPNRGWEPYDETYTLPQRLHEAGVKFAITSGSAAQYVNRLPTEAGAAMAYGLPEDVALEAVTIRPAEFLGIDDRVGSLEVGKDATLLITTGNPLEYSTEIEQAFIQGRKIDMQDIHRQFFERYMEKLRQVQAGSDNDE